MDSYKDISIFKETKEMAEMLKDGGDFIPASFKGKPGAIFAAILTGKELGIPPMASLRSLYVVHGKVGMHYDAIIGRLRSHNYEIEWPEDENNEKIATIILTHSKGKSFKHSYTIEEAAKAGLVGRDNWKKRPALMLRARCVASAARSFAGDIFSGIYEKDELLDIQEKENIIDVGDYETGEQKLLDVLKSKKQEEVIIDVEEKNEKIPFSPKEQDQFSVKINEKVGNLTVVDFRSLINGALTKHDLRMVSSKITLSRNITEEDKKDLRECYAKKAKEMEVQNV